MVVGEPKRSIMEGIENTGDVRLHDHRLRLKQRFDIIRKLGQGTYGKVQLGINKKTSQEVAIKTIKKCKIETEADLVRIRREVQIMSSVRHPNIVHIYEVFENSEKMILVMEYCAGGELYDYLSQQKVLQEDEARRLFRQIATASYYCHKHKICHRDLKLENVLLDEHGNAKIADFGLSNVFEERRLLSTFCGSPLYASPEIVKGTPYIGPEVDCWSLGVLLYTLVYGAMPFDGSNFKRLVKQISTGDYFEPKNPSSASPLIRDMLTVDPIQRADIVHICDHPWVNKGSDVSCLELAEALANETPVRLDLLLSLAPPPQHGSDKLVVTDEATSTGAEGSPGHSMSMTNVDNSAERRILEMVAEGGTDAIKPSPTRTIVGVEQPKRKLETTVSMDNAAGLRKKERFIRSSSQINQTPSQNEEAPVSPTKENNAQPTEIQRDVSMSNENKWEVSASSQVPKAVSPSKERVEEASIPVSKEVDVPLPPVVSAVDEPPSELPPPPPQNKTPVNAKKDIKTNLKVGDSVLKERNCIAKPSVPSKKKFVITSKTDEKKGFKPKEKSPPRKSLERESTPIKKPAVEEQTLKSEVTVEIKPAQPTERRKSRILDAAEKLNNLTIQPAQASPPPVSNLSPPLPKPKKVIIPGVSVGSFKEQFERRASLTSGSAPTVGDLLKKAPNKTVQANTVGQPVVKTLPVKKVHSVDSEHPVTNNKESTNIKLQSIGVEPSPPPKEKVALPPVEPRMFPLPDTASKISKPLHKSESLKEPSPRKDTLHNSLSLEDARRSLQQSMALLSEARNDYHTSRSVEDNSTGENERQKQLKVAREIISNAIGEENGKKVHRICMGGKPPIAYGAGGRSASGSLSLGGRTSPPPSPPRTFRTEVQHRVDDVRNKFLPTSRGGSVERIIPISFMSDAPKPQNTHTQLPYQRNKTMPYRLSSIPRGNVQAEVEKVPQPPTPSAPSTSQQTAEPIKKSPREFIIPIAVEGVGYVTPRQGSLEPSENKTPTKMPSSNISFSSRFPKPRRLSSLVSGGESEDDEDLHMHRLRSSRRVRADAEKDSISSGEEDDDEGFELLTAENLFSTLLDRVRSLTNRLNGEEGTGFPQHHQSLFNNLHSPFFNSPHLPRKHKKHSTIREGPSWRRSTSRDIASDFDSMFPSHTTFPRGSKRRSRKSRLANGEPLPEPSTAKDNPGNPDISAASDTLDLSDLDLSKMELSEKEVEALSGLTPALSRRLQQQLLAHLPPAAARSLRRTLSAHLPPSSHPVLPYTRSLSATKQADSDAPNSEISKCEPEIETNANAGYSSPSFSDSVSVQLPPSSLTSLTTLPNTRSLSTTRQTDIDTPTPEISKSQSEIETNSYEVPPSSQTILRYTRSPSITKQTDSYTPAPVISNYSPDIEVNSNADYSSSSFLDSASLKNAKSWHSIDSTGKYDSSPISESITPKAPSVGRYTPDGSCLSKYLSGGEEYPTSLRGYEHSGLLERESAGGSALSSIPMGGSLRRRSLRTPPADTSHRRVSRFLRPDFFDTPREESLYVRDKKEKELETQKILKEIRQKKSRHSDLASPNSPVAPTDISDILSVRSGYRNSLSPVGIPVPKDKSRSVTPFHPILDNISEYHSDPIIAKDGPVAVDNKSDSTSHNCQTDKSSFSKIQSPSQNIYPSVNTDRGSFKFNNKESRLVRPKSFPTKSYEEDSYNAMERNVGKKEACSNIPTNSFTSKDSKLTRPKSYPSSSQSPEKAFNVPPVTENSNPKQVNNTNHCEVAKPVPLRNGSLENEQNVTVSFSVCLPSRNANKLNVLKTESSSKELSIKKYVVVKADAELKKEAPISNNADNSELMERKDSMKILPKSVSGLSPLSESALLLKPDKVNLKVSDIESTLKSDVLEAGIQLENNSLSINNSVRRISPEKRITDVANNTKPKVLDSDINLEQVVLAKNSVDKSSVPNKVLEITTSPKSDAVTADSCLENNSLSKTIIGSTLTPVALTSDNILEKVEGNTCPLIKSDLEEKLENPCPEEKKKKTLGKKKIIIKKKVVKKTDSTSDTSKNMNAIIKDKPPKNEEEKIVPAKKKSVLHSIGEKIEKFRNDSFNRSASQEKDSANEAKSKPQLPSPKDEVKPSRIENVMRALRERSVPCGDMAEPITESGLIKRAVTVTDLPTLDTKLSTSKKSVNRVLGLFKKIESKDKSNKITLEKSGNDLVNVEVDPLPIEIVELPKCSDIQLPENNKPKRPTSLLLNGIGKRVQACYNGASSDSVLTKEIKSTSKAENVNSYFDGELKSQKKGLRLDFSRLPKLNQGIFNKRNSLDLSKSREGSQSKEVESNNERQSESYHKTREGSQSKEVERNQRCQSLTTRPNPERCQSIEVESNKEWQSQCLTTHQNPERCHSKEVQSNNEWQDQSYHNTGTGEVGREGNHQHPEEVKSKDIENNLQWQSQSSLKSQECRELDGNGNTSWESQNYDPAIDTFSNGVTKVNECSSNNSNNNYSPANNTIISPNWSPDCDTSKFMIEQDADYNQSSSQPPHRNYEATSPDPENIIDRIRRKSFYNRFNEKKNRRKSQLVGPGAKEYIPSERIHSQVDGDSSYHSKYDYTPSSSKYERPQTLEFGKLSDNGGSSSPTKYRGTDHLSPTSHKSLDRNERRYLLEPQYQPYSENNLHYSMPRYSRTVSLLDNNDGYQPATEYKNTSSRYGRSFSLLSPTSYSTLSPRAPPRNSAILLRDSGDVEPTTESVLTKIRNRKKLAAMSPTTDDEESYLDKKIRSNHTSNNEHDKSTDQAE